MGVSIGNTPSNPYIYAGTAGLLVYQTSDPSKLYILSNNHVLGATGPDLCPGTADPGTTWTIQPGTLDIGADPGNDPYYQVGIVNTFVPIKMGFRGKNLMDAALAETSAQWASSNILGIGMPTAPAMEATVGQTVTKSGRTTGVTSGTVEALNVSLRVSYGRSCGKAKFVNQISITPGTFSDSGDSGSAILDSQTLRPVALLFAGSDTNTVGSPMSTVLSTLGVSIHTNNLVASDTLDEGVDMRQSLSLLRDIQSRHEDALLSITGVSGVGIGMSEAGDEPAFIVYIEKDQPAKYRKMIPDHLEGIPVRIIRSGIFKAY